MNRFQSIVLVSWLVVLFVGYSFSCKAQEYSPVQWAYTIKKTGHQEYELHITGTLQSSWHTYSQHTPAGGPFPTKVTFTKNPILAFNGPTQEAGEMQETYDQNFKVDVEYFDDRIELIQKVVLKAAVKVAVVGELEYMACNDHQCLPPKVIKFSVPLEDNSTGTK